MKTIILSLAFALSTTLSFAQNLTLDVRGVENDNIARLVPSYHSLGTVRDTFVVPFVAVAGTGTKCVI